MLLQTPVRLPPQPLRNAEPVAPRQDSSESKPDFERGLGGARRSLLGDRAAVVQFGAVALGLARSRGPGSSPSSDDVEESDGPESSEAPESGEADASSEATNDASASSPASGSAQSSSSTKAASGPGAEPSDEERTEINDMKRRDREVRTHEQAHKSAGGAYAGSIRLSYQMGPDGKRYAVDGSVSIDVSPVAGDPAATLRKMEVVHRAANAPASPSGEDHSVAAQAQRVSQQARAQLAAERYAQARELVQGA